MNSSDGCVAAMVVLHYYRQPGVAEGALSRKLRELKALSPLVESVTSELCYNVEVQQPFSGAEEEKMRWILSSPLHPGGLQTEPHLHGKHCGSLLIEIGPRLAFLSVKHRFDLRQSFVSLAQYLFCIINRNSLMPYDIEC